MASVVSVLLVLLGSLTVASAQNSLNFATLKNDIRVFERIVDERLKQGFSAPFATSDPQAAYLQGYGVVVSFYLNISRGKIRTPYGEIQLSEGQLASGERDKQLQKVREIMIRCLADHAASIKQLGAHDRISISAHVEDRNELDPAKRRTVMVVTTSRDDVDLLAMRKISADEFKERLHLAEY